MPDNTIEYASDDDEQELIFAKWKDEHPTWKQNSITGRWYDEEETKEIL